VKVAPHLVSLKRAINNDLSISPFEQPNGDGKMLPHTKVNPHLALRALPLPK